MPYDKVWLAGANDATTIEFSSSITINGKSLDSGKYALFIIPKEYDKWTIIFNKTHKQWGAFKYDENEDALKIEVSPKRTAYQTENLTYSIEQIRYQYGSIILKWEYLEVEIPFETNYLEQFEQEIESRAGKQPDYLKWIVYLQGAEHLEKIDAKTNIALLWINQAEDIMNSSSEWNEQFYPRDYIKGHLYWTKAKLLSKTKNYKEALDYGYKLKNLENNLYYNKMKEVEKIESLINVWQQK